MLGWSKKTTKFYKEITRLLGIKPSDILHVGDSYERDYLSAKKAGLKTILYSPSGCNRVDIPSSECISSLVEVLELIKS